MRSKSRGGLPLCHRTDQDVIQSYLKKIFCDKEPWPMANYVHITASIDGLIPSIDGGLDWLKGL